MAQPAGSRASIEGQVEERNESISLDVVRALSREEARTLFDRQARELMGMSGAEFLRRYDAGEFDAMIDTPEYPWLAHLEMLVPLGR